MSEIQYADPRARRRALLFLATGAAVGAVVLSAMTPIWGRLREWVAEDPAQAVIRLRLVATSTGALVAIPTLVLAARWWQLGERVVRSSRFPPPDMPVVRDTVIWHGQAARRRGRLLQGVALLLSIAVSGLLMIVWRVLSLLRKGR